MLAIIERDTANAFDPFRVTVGTTSAAITAAATPCTRGVGLKAAPANAGTIVDDTGATVAAVEAETDVGINTENRTVLARVGDDSTSPWRIVSQERLREVPA